MINIYCDESCHLPHDNSPIMVIGGIMCPANIVRSITEKIFRIKKEFHIYKYAEIKWTKVSQSKLPMFKALVDLFFDNPDLNFRAVIATGKQQLDLEKFGLSYDDWYYRMYYLVLKELVRIGYSYSIYIDIKDTRGAQKVETLKTVLNHTLYDFYNDTIKRIQLVRSDQIQLLQLTDLFIGAVCYDNRAFGTSEAKMELIDYIEKRSGRPLQHSTPRTEDKFNLFKWVPQEKQ